MGVLISMSLRRPHKPVVKAAKPLLGFFHLTDSREEHIALLVGFRMGELVPNILCRKEWFDVDFYNLVESGAGRSIDVLNLLAKL